jgi:energy-converting hydrogenase B subunit I
MSEMSKIVRTITSITFPFILIYGLYVITHGHLTPGGGFQGGAIVASGLAMLVVAFGSKWTFGKIKEKNLTLLESLGAICFILVALLGLGFGSNQFFYNFIAKMPTMLFGTAVSFGNTAANIDTGGVLPLMNFAVGLKVIAGLFAIVLVMAYASSFKEEHA